VALTTQEKPEQQFTRDDVAGIIASAITTVLEHLKVMHQVEGVAVFPAGAGASLVDLVMRDLSTNSTWGISITIPPAKEQPDGLT